MYYLFTILILVAALLMIGIVLIQESKGGGLSSNFSAGNQLAGVRKTTDFIEKTTWGLAAAMVILSVLCAYTAPSVDNENIIDAAQTSSPLTNPATQQNFGASQAPAEGAEAAPAKQEAAPAAPAKQEAAPAKQEAAPAKQEAAPAKQEAAPAAPAEEKK